MGAARWRLSILLSLALVVVLARAVVTRPSPAREIVYTVAQVRAGLSRSPGRWVGRTVLVRGSVVGCRRREGCLAPLAGIPAEGLVDGIPIIEMPRTTVLSLALPLQVEQDPLWAFLRRVPPLRQIVPAPPRLFTAQPATYRVRLVVLTPCALERVNTSCVAALLRE